MKDPPKAPATTNWADATEDLDPSGQCKKKKMYSDCVCVK